jgi:hypothetical protein
MFLKNLPKSLGGWQMSSTCSFFGWNSSLIEFGSFIYITKTQKEGKNLASFGINPVTFWYGTGSAVPLSYGSGSCSFSSAAFKMSTKNNFFSLVFCLLLFEGSTFTSVFKDKK